MIDVPTFRANGWVLARQFVTGEDVARLGAACGTQSLRRCHTGDPNITWSEATLSSGHPGHDFFMQPRVREIAERLSPHDLAAGVRCWISAYQEGEFIERHVDRVGELQVLVCLENVPSPSGGGLLVVGADEIWLEPGDVVFFAAARVEHHTTPLIRTKAGPDPRRVVLVGRYFGAGTEVEAA